MNIRAITFIFLICLSQSAQSTLVKNNSPQSIGAFCQVYFKNETVGKERYFSLYPGESRDLEKDIKIIKSELEDKKIKLREDFLFKIEIIQLERKGTKSIECPKMLLKQSEHKYIKYHLTFENNQCIQNTTKR